MFEYINGKVAELNGSYAILEAGGIGYFIKISLNTYTKLKEKKEAKLFLHQVLREDTNDLYGFIDKSGREIFRLLISVSGIGANTARVMLSSLTTAEVQKAILENDVNTIKSVKGIGIKTAQRVIVDLRDKIGKVAADSGDIFDVSSNTNKDESLSALVMLGFSKKLAEKAIDKATKSDKNLSVEDIIKKSLKSLS